jgi:hypothetical protein
LPWNIVQSHQASILGYLNYPYPLETPLGDGPTASLDPTTTQTKRRMRTDSAHSETKHVKESRMLEIYHKINMYTLLHVCIYIYPYIYIYNIYTYVLYIHYKHTNIQTYKHTYIHTYIYIYCTYIHMCVYCTCI